MDTLWQQVAVFALPVLLAITVHEAAHGWVAHRLGDDTAYRLGRVTFNPFKHIDWIGTLLVPAVILAISSLGGTPLLFGWAKPVPVDYYQLRRPRRDMALVALAGPSVNLFMALLWGIWLHLLISAWPWSAHVLLTGLLITMAAAGVLINVLLLALNLFPLLPLDGGRVVNALLPTALSHLFMRLEPFGLIILLILLVTGTLAQVLQPAVAALLTFIPGNTVVRDLFPI